MRRVLAALATLNDVGGAPFSFDVPGIVIVFTKINRRASFSGASPMIVLRVDNGEPTPAHLYADGKNYVPTRKWATAGQRFAAIAAAGPLAGPVLAAQFGFYPGFI